MQIPFLGGAYEGKSTSANVQKCINLYLEHDRAGGKSSLMGLPGLERFLAIPNKKPTYNDDYTNLLTFKSPYTETTGVTFTMTSNIEPHSTGNQIFTGVLSGLSDDSDETLYFSNFRIGFYRFDSDYKFLDSVSVDIDATSTWSISETVDCGTDYGTKVMRLEDPGVIRAVTSISIANGYFAIAGDYTTDFYYGRDLMHTGHASGDKRYTIQYSVYDSDLDTTYIYVKETIPDESASAIDFVNYVDIYAVAYYPKYMVRSLNVPRDNTTILSGSILPEHEYKVIGTNYQVTYFSLTYESAKVGSTYDRDTFTGIEGYTTFTDNGEPGAVIDMTTRRMVRQYSHVTKTKDLAMALIAACAKGENNDADGFAKELFKCIYPLDQSTHSNNKGNIADEYYTHGYSSDISYTVNADADTQKIIVPNRNITEEFFQGVIFRYTGSAVDNDGEYQVAYVEYTGGNTEIALNQDFSTLTANEANKTIYLVKHMAVNPYFRCDSAMWASMALLFYSEKYRTAILSQFTSYTTNDRDDLSPSAGDMIWNTTLNVLQFYSADETWKVIPLGVIHDYKFGSTVFSTAGQYYFDARLYRMIIWNGTHACSFMLSEHTEQLTSISSPTRGQIAYSADTDRMHIYNNLKWKLIVSGEAI